MRAWRSFRRAVPGWVALVAIGALLQGSAFAGSLMHCSKPLASVVVQDPDVDWWTAMSLASPRLLLEAIVDDSGCLTRLDPRQDAAAKPDFALTSDLGGIPGDGGSTMGGSLATDGVEGTSGTLPPPPIARQGAYEVVLALTDLRGANPVLRTRGGTGPVARYNDPILIAGLGWSGGQVYINTVQGRRIANAYIEAYRAIVTAVERQLKNATRKKD